MSVDFKELFSILLDEVDRCSFVYVVWDYQQVSWFYSSHVACDLPCLVQFVEYFVDVCSHGFHCVSTKRNRSVRFEWDSSTNINIDLCSYSWMSNARSMRTTCIWTSTIDINGIESTVEHHRCSWSYSIDGRTTRCVDLSIDRTVRCHMFYANTESRLMFVQGIVRRKYHVTLLTRISILFRHE
jgi:ribosomal protein L31